MNPIKNIEKLRSKIPSNIKKAIIYSIIFGLICHIYMLTNKFVNHDEIGLINYHNDLSSSGRWFLKYATIISSYLSMPWINGMLSILYLSFISAIIIDLFNIKSNIFIILLSAICTTFPAIAAIFPYMSHADGYFLATLFSVLAAFIFIKYKYGFIAFIILNLLSLGVYQAFLGLSISIIIIHNIHLLINKKVDYKYSIKSLIKTFICSILTLILYMIMVKYIINVQLTTYGSLDKMGQIDFSKLHIYLLASYKEFINFFLIDKSYQFGIIKYLNIILIAISLILLVNKNIWKNIDFKEKVLILLLIFILPININSILILSQDTSVGLRLKYPYICVYLLIILLVKIFINKNNEITNKFSSLLIYFVIFVFTITIFKFIITSNKAYFAMDLDNKNLYAYTNRLINKIEEKSFYSKDKEIIFISEPDITNDFVKSYTTPDIQPILFLDYKIVSNGQWTLYPNRFLAFDNHINKIWLYDIEKEIKDKDLLKLIKEKPVYPNSDSIFEYNNKIYVKFKNY